MQHTLGIDVSKDRLDAHALAPARRGALPMTAPAWARLLSWTRRLGTPLVVYEATGPYHRLLERALAGAGIGFHKVNPLRARRFAEGCGRLAKTDRIAQDARCQRDAEMLARMGAALALEAQVPTPQNLCELKDLLTARRALARDLARERTRTPTSALLRRLAAARERLLLGQMAMLDAEIAARIAADPGLARARKSFAPFPASGRSPPPSSSSTCPSSAASAGARPRAWPASPRSPGSRASPTARRTSAAAARACAARSTCRRWWPCAATQASRPRRSAWPPGKASEGHHHRRDAQPPRPRQRPPRRRPALAAREALTRHGYCPGSGPGRNGAAGALPSEASCSVLRRACTTHAQRIC